MDVRLLSLQLEFSSDLESDAACESYMAHYIETHHCGWKEVEQKSLIQKNLLGEQK